VRRMQAVAVLFLCFFSTAFAYDWSTNPGDGSTGNPYQISEPEQLNSIGVDTSLWDKCFILTNDIDMYAYAGTQYNIIGTYFYNPYTGIFDGNGYKISNLTYITSETIYCVGVFGYISNATIKNLGIENVNLFTGGGDVVGGLVGRNDYGTLAACYVTGSVGGTGDGIGGLVGINNFGVITSCYAICSTSGNLSVGGLAGMDGGSLIYCYAAGAVNGTDYVGGLVGYSESASWTACFWDIESSGQTISAEGEGRLTAEMKTLSMFIDAGWDFAGEFQNGNEDIWGINCRCRGMVLQEILIKFQRRRI
jgi:hypothetical protein